MARAKYYEKLLLIPSESIATIIQYKPGWVVSTLIPPTKRTIVLGANGTKATQKAQVKTPLLLWLQQYALNKSKPGFEPSMYLYAAKKENKDLWLAPYRIGNVHEDGRICWGSRNNTPNNLRAAHSTFFTSPFSTDLWDGQDELDDLERDSDYDANGNLRAGRQDALNKRLVNSFAKFAREYEVGNGEEYDDEFTDDHKEAIYGEAHVSFPKHCDAVFVSSRPATMKKFPEKARRLDRHGRPFIVGFAIRRIKDWLINVEGTSVPMVFDNKTLKTKKQGAEAPAPPKVQAARTPRSQLLEIALTASDDRFAPIQPATQLVQDASMSSERFYITPAGNAEYTTPAPAPTPILVPQPVSALAMFPQIPVTPEPVVVSTQQASTQGVTNEN